MTTFRVWAPLAAAMDVVLDSARLPMTMHGEWWELDLPAAGPGSDYAFAVDGGDPLPDPRSAWQPAGVHGPSRVVDHAAFRWTDSAWLGADPTGCVMYELHVGTFTPEGTFDSAISRLDHLVDLGIGMVDVMPVNAFPGTYGWGYDGVGLYAVHEPYGGPGAFQRFVDACHARGIGVVLDVVYNHLGPAGNYLDRFGPYFTQRYATPWGAAVNLDGPGSDGVREFVRHNAEMWLRDYHCDGLRLDAAHALFDQSARHVLEELAECVDALGERLGRRLFLLAESDLNDPRVVRDRALGGFGVHAQWSDDFHHALHAVLCGERDGYYADFGQVAQLAKALTGGYVFTGEYSQYRRRRHGRPVPGDVPLSRILGYLQNHDQTGNRAQGDRSSHLLSQGLLRVAGALVLTAPFIPMLFMGEEWGASTPFQYFTSHEDGALADAVRKGRREEFAAFGWDPDDVPDPQARETFERSRLDWDERDREPHSALLAWHRELIALRRERSCLRDGGRPDVRFDERAKWLAMRRGPIEVVANLAATEQDVCVPPASSIRLTSDPVVRLHGDRLRLPGESVAILDTR